MRIQDLQVGPRRFISVYGELQMVTDASLGVVCRKLPTPTPDIELYWLTFFNPKGKTCFDISIERNKKLTWGDATSRSFHAQQDCVSTEFSAKSLAIDFLAILEAETEQLALDAL